VLLDGTESSLSEIKKALGNAKSEKSAVWYYRESSMGELPQQAMEVLKLVIENICRSVCQASLTFRITSMKKANRIPEDKNRNY
jgi:hypothetical protein